MKFLILLILFFLFLPGALCAAPIQKLQFLKPHEFSITFDPRVKDLYIAETEDNVPFAKGVRVEIANKVSFLCKTMDDILIAKAEGICNQTDVEMTFHSPSSSEPFIIFSRKKTPLTIAEFQIFNKSRHVIASGTMNWLGSRFVLYDNENKQMLVTYYRPYVGIFGDKWFAQVNRQTKLDYHAILLIGMIETYLGNMNSEFRF